MIVGQFEILSQYLLARQFEIDLLLNYRFESATQTRRLTTYSTGLALSLPFINRRNSSPVNSGVRPSIGFASNPKHHSDESVKRMTQNTNLRSGVLSSPADVILSRAISETLKAPAGDRVQLFEQFVREIESYMATHPVGRPWTCMVYTGTDGSRIFRGGIGHSLVIDPDGRLWRARSYEDFETTYTLTERTCEIRTLTPLFEQMREYLPRSPLADSNHH